MSARLRPIVAVLVLLVVSVAGCSGTSLDEEREAVVYDEIVRWLLENHLQGAVTKNAPLYFEPLGTEGITLEVQVEMIELLDDYENVRFIDEREEAIDPDDAHFAVNDGGVLIGLGAVPATGPTIVRTELYQNDADISALRFELVENGSDWDIVADPEPIPVEHFSIRVDGD